jgi:hypothetical protein
MQFVCLNSGLSKFNFDLNYSIYNILKIVVKQNNDQIKPVSMSVIFSCKKLHMSTKGS